jgi:hypothetical protein
MKRKITFLILKYTKDKKRFNVVQAEGRQDHAYQILKTTYMYSLRKIDYDV